MIPSNGGGRPAGIGPAGRWWAVLLLASLFGACNAPESDALRRHGREEAAVQAAIDVVRRFFAALPEGDCARLAPMLALDRAGAPCAEVVAEYNDHQVRLIEVESAVKDGRDPRAILVRARLSQGGEPQKQVAILRVVNDRGVWRLKP